MMRLLICLLVYILSATKLLAQKDTVVLLQELQISDARLVKHLKGDKLETIDTIQLINNQGSTLAEILSRNAGVNIRSYGLAGLATPSFRGTGSSHSALLWEGYNLQSVMNGSADLNLLPITFIDDVILQYGGSSSLNGSGTMGGAININSNKPKFGNQQQHIALNTQMGSYGSRFVGLNTARSFSNVFYKIRVFKQVANNDYEFYNRFNQKNERLENSAVDKYGIMIENAYKIKPNQQLSFKYWFQDNTVEIPGPISAGGTSQQLQEDVFHRASGKFEWAGKSIYLSAKSGAFWYQLDYDNGFSGTSSSTSFTSISEIVAEKKILPFWSLESGINYTASHASTQSYGELRPSRKATTISITNSLDLNQKLTLGISAGEALDGTEWTPPSFSVNTQYLVNPTLQFRTKWAKSFRLPTFNDLYWRGSSHGNPDLVSEDGYSLDVGAIVQLSKKQISHRSDLTLFYNNISNWIQWRPVSASGWTPINVDEIWSFGLEYRGNLTYALPGDHLIKFNYSYNFLKATNQRPTGKLPLSFSSPQLPYSPEHQANATIGFQSRKFYLDYSHRLTSKQYTEENNNERFALKKYHVGDFTFRYNLAIAQNHDLSLIAQVNNLWDTAYEVRSAYPMPGRNFRFTVTYQFN